MQKKLFSNKPYLKKDLTLAQRIHEVLSAFWQSKSNWASSKNSKKYFQNSDIKNWIVNSKPIESSIKPAVTWIGHSTFLIQISGVNILTDPIFHDMMYFYPRNCAPGIALDDLPKIDFIIISHAHVDHMEKKSLLKLKKHKPTILIPKGNKGWFDKNRFESVFEKEWWQENAFPIKDSNLEKIKFSFLPAVHWTGTNVFSINKTWWGSFLIEAAGFKIYFAGDSAYSKHFLHISEKFPNIDLAFLPISPNKPANVVQNSHIDAEQAVQVFLDLKAKSFIPMHWGTFRMATDKFYEPIERLKDAWKKNMELLQNKKLHVLKFGEQLKFDFDFQAKQLYDYESR